LVERVSVSTKRVVGLVPIGGAQVIDTTRAGAPLWKPKIGVPDETENHDPAVNNGDCEALNAPTPLFRIEIVCDPVVATEPKAMVDDGTGVDE